MQNILLFSSLINLLAQYLLYLKHANLETNSDVNAVLQCVNKMKQK